MALFKTKEEKAIIQQMEREEQLEVFNTQLRSLIYWQLCKFIYSQIIVLKEYSTAIRLDKSYYHIERRSFSSSIWSEQAHNLTLTHLN